MRLDEVHRARTIVLQVVEADRPILISFDAELVVGILEPAPLGIVGADSRAVHLDVAPQDLLFDEVRLSCLTRYH